MTTPHEQHDECQSQFVSYKWFSWALISVLIAIITVSVAAAVNITEIKSVAHTNKEKLNRLEDILDYKLDKIIELINED